MVKEYKHLPQENSTSAILKIMNMKEEGFLCGRMETNTLATSRKASSMDKASIHSLREQNISANTLRGKDRAKDLILFNQGQDTLVIT